VLTAVSRPALSAGAAALFTQFVLRDVLHGAALAHLIVTGAAFVTLYAIAWILLPGGLREAAAVRRLVAGVRVSA
jgi:hypothetical protein